TWRSAAPDPYPLPLHAALPIWLRSGPWTDRRSGRRPPPGNSSAPGPPPRPPGRKPTRHLPSRTTPPPLALRPEVDSSPAPPAPRSEEHTSELQSRFDLVCRLLL